MIINPYRFAAAAPTLTYFSQFFWTRTGDESDKSGYSYRVIVPSSALSCSGQKVRLTLMAASGEGCVIDHVSIGEYAGSGYDVTGSLTEVTFTGSSGCTILADGVKSSDYITLAADAAKSYVVVIDVATSANDSLGTSGSHTGFDTGYKSATASWDQTTVSGFSSATAGLCIGLKEIAIGADIDASTVLLVHGDGADAATTFQDFSPTGHTVTANGNAQVDRAQSVFGGASILLDGSGDYLSVADSADFHFGTGALTIESRMRWSSVNNTMLYRQISDSNNQVYAYFEGSTLYFGAYSGGSNLLSFTASWTRSANTWYHVAIVSNGAGNWYFFVDGSSVALTKTGGDWTASLPDIAADVQIGGDTTASYYMNGWLDEIRISKGSARYTAGFTPVTKEFGA